MPASEPPQHLRRAPGRDGSHGVPNRRRLVSNFAALSLAEMACRAVSVAVTLNLAKRLGAAGYGRIEFSFNLVCWLVLLVREGMDVIAAREIARHPRLVRPFANQVTALRLVIATTLWCLLAIASFWLMPGATERIILLTYGLLLITTSVGLDFVYRGLERMGIVAVSMCIRTATYAICVALLVFDSGRITWVPALLVFGESFGIALVWVIYTRQYGLPRPSLRGGRFLRVFVQRGRTIYLIQVSQAAIVAMSIVVVGLRCGWHDVGVYSASHRMVAAVLTFGLIFQQVAFPSLARSWRASPEAGRAALNGFVRVLTLVFIPIAVGTCALSGLFVHVLLGDSYSQASRLLSIEIWRAPLLSIAFLYQSALIALNRESVGVRVLVVGALGSMPVLSLMLHFFGLNGVAIGSVAIAFALMAAGFERLRWDNRHPAWHHQLGQPLIAAMVMLIPCLALQSVGLLASVVSGAVTYVLVLFALGGLRVADLKPLFAQSSPQQQARHIPPPHGVEQDGRPRTSVVGSSDLGR